MATETTTIKGSKLNDEPLPSTSAVVEKPKPKEQTAEQKTEWQKVKDKAHARMFPNAKPDKEDEKAPAKPAAKEKVETTTQEPKEKGKAAAPAKAPAKQSTDDSGKQGEKEEGKVEKTEQEPKLKPSAKKEAAPPAVDLEKLATTVATATAKAIKDSEKKETKVEDDVPEGRRRDVAAIEYLEKNNPKYKGKLDAYKKFARDEAAFAAKWEKENGRKFDPTDDEHSEWYDKHEPDIDPDDVNEARVELAAERRARALVEQETSGTKKEIEEIRLQRDLERAERPLQGFLKRNIDSLAGAMGEDVAKAFGELKGDETLEGKDPAAHQTLNALLPDLHNQTIAAARIFGTNGRAYNAKDPVHVEVGKAAMELQDIILGMPEDEQKTPDGRTYATLDAWAGMSDADKGKHWTIDANAMTAFLAKKTAGKAKEIYKTERDKAENIARAYGFTKNGEAHKEQTAKVQEREEEAEDNGKVRSPSTAGRTIHQPGVKTSVDTAKTGGDRLLGRMFGR